MAPEPLLERKAYVSYNQLMVADAGLLPGLLWEDAHMQQGFVRRPPARASFSTLIEDGYCELRCFAGRPPAWQEYVRVIVVPFTTKGEIRVEGPDEDKKPMLHVEPGHYRLFAAQRPLDGADVTLRFDMFLERLAAPLNASEIVVADGGLDPPEQLVEVGDVA